MESAICGGKALFLVHRVGALDLELASTITLRTGADEEVLELEEFEARIERGHVDPAAEVCFPPVTGGRFVRAAELDAFRGLYEPKTLYFSRAFTLGRIPILTLALSLLNLAVFLLEGRDGPVDAASMVALGAKAGPLLHDLGQLWRLVTANFVHRDWTHLGFNMFVLFHFGAALENAYRPLDWIWILAAAALGTTVGSYAMTDAVSAGASGVAYGFLGGAMVFGLKYRRILPDRYRAVLGGAVVPTVLIFLYLGFTSTGVDNWGHVGGLLAGGMAAVPLRPRLLGEAPSRSQRLLSRVVPLAVVGLGLLAAGHLLEGRLPILEPVRDRNLGLELQIPSRWQHDATIDGALAFHNGMAAPVRASLAASVRPIERGTDLEVVAREFVNTELRTRASDGRLSGLSLEPLRYAHVAGLPGVKVEATFLADGARTDLAAHFFARGGLLYTLVLARPVGLPAYGDVFERMLAGIRPIEPAFLLDAREAAEAAPNDAGSWLALGRAEARVGSGSRARAALEKAASLAPADPAPIAALAALAFDEGLPREGCRLAGRARALGPERPETVEVLERCRGGNPR